MSDEQLPLGDDLPPTEPVGEPTPTEPLVCTNCAAPLDADQTYCLECGTPTAVAPPLRKVRRNIATVGTALFLLGVGAGALTYAVAKGDSKNKSGTGPTLPIVSAGSTQLVPSTSTGGAVSEGTLPSDTTGSSTGDASGTSGTAGTDTNGLPAVTGVGTITTDTNGSTTDSVVTDSSTLGGTTSRDSTESVRTTASDSTESTESTASTESTPDLGTPGDGASAASGWPAGKVGWTVQVSSVRKAADARRLAKRIKASGQPAGVLLSSDYSTYREKGYWVVFSGVYSTQAGAAAHKATLGTTYGRTIVHKVAA